MSLKGNEAEQKAALGQTAGPLPRIRQSHMTPSRTAVDSWTLPY